MHFYPHNIADFNNATRYLTRVERSVYRDAIEMYYDSESPLPSANFDRLCKVLLCVTDEERAALQTVLDDFFVLTERGYVHSRCEEEIEKYRLNSSAKARAGKASAEARKNKKEQMFNTCSTHEQLTNKQEPRTNNQEPIDLLAPQAALPTTKKNRAARLPDDWQLTDEYVNAVIQINPALMPRIQQIAAGFRDYWIAKSGKDATKNDWLATWRNWIRRESENAKNRPTSPGGIAKQNYGQQRGELFDALTDYQRATNF